MNRTPIVEMNRTPIVGPVGFIRMQSDCYHKNTCGWSGPAEELI